MAKVRRIDFSPTEWLEGCAELDNAARGLYITACALMWARGGPIDVDLLRAASRDHGHAFNRQFERLVSLDKLTVNGRQIENKRAINELQKAEERTAKASQNGIKGNEIKQLKTATRSLDHHANHQPSTINSKESSPIGEPKKRGTRWQGTVPEDWVSEATTIRAEAGLPPIAGVLEAEKFVDHWTGKTGAAATKLDWHATWRNWVRNARSNGVTNGRRRSAVETLYAGAMAAADEWERRETDSGASEPTPVALLDWRRSRGIA